MSRLHEMRKVGFTLHMSEKEELEGTKDKRLYRPRLCSCPECGKSFKCVGDLIEHQDDLQCGIIPL